MGKSQLDGTSIHDFNPGSLVLFVIITDSNEIKVLNSLARLPDF